LKNTANESQWCPFRPNAVDLEKIAKDVAEIPNIQRKFLANNADLKFPDRVAHQFQIAGSRVLFQVANDPPEPLLHVGLFERGAQDHAAEAAEAADLAARFRQAPAELARRPLPHPNAGVHGIGAAARSAVCDNWDVIPIFY
jgi:hypothetical protein